MRIAFNKNNYTELGCRIVTERPYIEFKVSEVIYLNICDKCGNPSEQDDTLMRVEILQSFWLELHEKCVQSVQDRIRISLGLKTESDINKLVKNGRYSRSIPS